jgi:hypothetical protein
MSLPEPRDLPKLLRVGPMQCCACGGPHHTQMATQDKSNEILSNADVQDLIWHATLTAYPGIRARFEPDSDEFAQAFFEHAARLGQLAACVASKAEAGSAAARELMRCLVAQGPGTYVLEVTKGGEIRPGRTN